MQCLAPIPEGGCERGGKTAAGDAEEVVETRGGRHAIWRQPIEGDRHQRHKEYAHGYPLYEQRHDEHPWARVRRVGRAHEVGDAKDHEGSRRKRARVVLANEASYERRDEDGRYAAGGGNQTCPRCGIAQLRLLPKRHQYEIPKEHRVAQAQCDGAEGKTTRLEQRQVYDGVLFGQLPDDPCGQGQHGYNGEYDNEFTGEPIQVLALIHHDLQRTDPHYQQRQAHFVDRQFEGRRFGAAKEAPAYRTAKEADRSVD